MAGVPGPVAVSVGAALVAMAGAWWGWRPGAARIVAIAGLGLVILGLRVTLGPGADPPPPLAAAGDGPWNAVVESMGSPRDGDQVARLRLDADGGSVTVAATLPGYPEVRAGDRVLVDGRLRPPPEDDPYGAYLTRTGASGSLDGRSLRIVGPGDAVSIQSVRDDAGDALRRALPEPEAGLAAAILIGLRERVDRELAAAFATAGVSHIVAISGWNIAIVAGIVAALLRGRPRRLITVAIGATIGGYVIVAGGSPSIVRAAVMAAVVLIARESGRAGRAPAALAWAAVVLLLVEPAMIADAGFRLSVAATAGLLAWSTPLGRWIGRVTGDRLPGWLTESLGISLAAQVATLPDVLATFGRLSLVAPVVNVLVVPIVPLAMAGGVIALLGGWASTLGAPAWIATLAGLPAWLLLHLIVTIIRAGAAVPVAAVSIPAELTLPVSALAAIMIAIVLGWRRRRRPHRGRPDGAATAPPPGPSRDTERKRSATKGRRRRPVLPTLSVAARAVLIGTLVAGSLGAGIVASSTSRATRLTVLDVGQGDAILVESASGPRMLVDGGPDPSRLMLLLDERIPPWDRRIDIVVLTHPHEDHVAGLVRVLQRYDVGRVYEPGMHGPGPGWRAWDAELQDGPPRGTLSTGEHIGLAEIQLDVLWPDPGTVPVEPGATGRAINDISIVLLGTANGRRFLLTGDAEDDVDPELIARGLPHVDVLKVAHHGSATATSQALIDALQPSVAVVSVGARNDYGHPSSATLERLRSSGARVYRTDRDGTVSLELRTTGVLVRTTGGRTAAAEPSSVTASAPRARDDAGGIAAPARSIARTGYDRSDDDPRSPDGRRPAALAPAQRLVPATRMRGRRRRRVARPEGERAGRRDRHAAGGDGRAAARRRQAARRPAARPPPAWCGVGGVARGQRLRRARSDRPRPSGDEPGEPGLRDVGSNGAARGEDRRLRGQARRSAARVDVLAVRLVASSVSARVGGPRQADRWRSVERGDDAPRRGAGTSAGT